ncbi:hypothetical protein BO86DRAFT_410465 [Aspergillus japonicus CBS 114.51]|uniref:Uncharacterized protein n=2 Tax=Aspergillus TaxID=5052 RepID=A0A2V5HKJ9_ASPV1|nr:hypothetical protein BO86DRAFT_410465 [Aspergillus japonicus CBS 114.51]PYI23032.1 hypothetical protein BO99DRAFT_429152 [Aspergillus violaceofuscus CBS 115571]RAH80916.1 hypothetical protein BO86DRAFT_410465 [Aspergillus japonicus CBS 114.51]
MEKLPRCSPAQATHRRFAEWPAMREQTLRECSIWDWTSLGLWRYGRSPSPADNPITILVSVRYDSVREYHTERKWIEAICARYEARDVSILFLKDELKLCCGVSHVPQQANFRTPSEPISGMPLTSKAEPSSNRTWNSTKQAAQPSGLKVFTTALDP